MADRNRTLYYIAICIDLDYLMDTTKRTTGHNKRIKEVLSSSSANILADVVTSYAFLHRTKCYDNLKDKFVGDSLQEQFQSCRKYLEQEKDILINIIPIASSPFEWPFHECKRYNKLFDLSLLAKPMQILKSSCYEMGLNDYSFLLLNRRQEEGYAGIDYKYDVEYPAMDHQADGGCEECNPKE